MTEHIRTAWRIVWPCWAILVVASILMLATNTAPRRNVQTPLAPKQTCISQTMEVVPCP